MTPHTPRLRSLRWVQKSVALRGWSVAKVLIIEDDEVLSAALLSWLEAQGHRGECSANGADGLQLLQCSGFDLALVDWQLPELSGPEVCEQYRRKGGKTPILMMTQKSHIADKELGLDSGADDYLPKPFDMRELAARVRALLRRSTGLFDSNMQTGQIALDYGRCDVTIRGRRIQLVPREFEVLEFLLRHAGTYIASERLISHIWDSDSSVTNEALRVCILRIRKKIETEDALPILESTKGLEYRISSAYSGIGSD